MTLDTDGLGNLVIKDSGVGTDKLAVGAVTNSSFAQSTSGVNITALDTWTEVESVTLTGASADGFVDVFWTTTVRAEGGSAGGAAYFDVRFIITFPGSGTSTSTYSNWGVQQGAPVQVSMKYPYNSTTGRSAGNITAKVEVRMTAQFGTPDPSTIEAYYSQISLLEIKR